MAVRELPEGGAFELLGASPIQYISRRVLQNVVKISNGIFFTTQNRSVSHYSLSNGPHPQGRIPHSPLGRLQLQVSICIRSFGNNLPSSLISGGSLDTPRHHLPPLAEVPEVETDTSI